MSPLRAELEDTIAENGWVSVCWDPACLMHRLPHWAEDDWVAHPRLSAYGHYTHGICLVHARIFRQEIERFLQDCAAEVAVAA